MKIADLVRAYGAHPNREALRREMTEHIREARPTGWAAQLPHLPPREGEITLGEYADTGEPYRISESKLRRHMYVVGESGSGKSRFLENLLHQEIALGNGFAVIDPTANFIERIKGHIAFLYHRDQDEGLLNRVILIDPTHPIRTITFNPLEVPANVSSVQQAAELVTIFHTHWSDEWGGRMEDIMENSFIALCEVGGTIPDLLPFFGDKDFRARILERVPHPIVRRYFEEEFDKFSPSVAAQALSPIRRKLRAFLLDDRVRQMVTPTKSSFNFRQAIDTRQIILMPLNEQLLGKPSASLLGSLFMSKIKMAAHSRADIPESQRIPFRLYVDEFQKYATDDFATVLAESRQFAFSLAISHQDQAQLPPSLRAAVLTPATRVAFRLIFQDSHRIAREFLQYDEDEVKSVRELQSGELSYTYRSAAEQRERLARDIQHLPDRSFYVNDKLDDDTARLYTVHVPLPHESLKMSERRAAEYIAQVPIGRKYLVERQAIEAENIVKAQPEPSSQLTKDEEAILLFISYNALTKVTQLYKAVNITTTKGTRLKEQMQAKGYVDELKVQLNQRGAPSKILLPTDEALKLLGRELPKGRGSPLHRNIQQIIKHQGRAKGYRVRDNDVEKNLSNGGIVDVHLEKDGERIGVEIAITSTPKRELAHISNCLADGYDKVFSFFLDETSLETTRARLNENLPAHEAAKVTLLSLKQISSFL